jgi:spermidine/putrescine transport system ATP-binding protein
MQIELKAIQEQVGLTFVCVTHHQEEALTMSDRVAVMHHGRVLQIGSPQEIYESPASLLVANFIGLSNHLTGRVTAANGTQCTLKAPGLPAIQARRPVESGEAGQMTLMLRPERLRLSHEHHRNGVENAVPARIEKAIYNGSEMHYWVSLSNDLQWRIRVPNAGEQRKRFQVGEAVFVSWRAGDGVALTE